MKKVRVALAIFILFAGLRGLSAESPVSLSVNTGHIGAVRALAYGKADGLLFSGGDDGTVRIWDVRSQTLVKDIHVSALKISAIAVNDTGPGFAVVETNGTSIYRISAWNWKLGEKMFVLELDEYPLYLGYSPKGSFLVYAETDWQSLTFLESETGRKLPYLGAGFGIVSHLAVSDTESTLIAYNPQGSISYWDLKSGVQRYQFKAPAGLQAMSVNGTKRYMAATDGRRLLYLDLAKDNRFAQVQLPNIVETQIQPETGLIACYARDPVTGAKSLTLWEYTSDRLVQKIFNPILPSGDITDMTLQGGSLYVGAADGSIRQISTSSSNSILYPQDRLASITGFASSGDTAFVSSGASLLSFSSDYLLRPDSASGVSYLTTSWLANPLGRPASIRFSSANELLLRTKDGQAGMIVRYNTATGAVDEHSYRSDFPLRDIDVTGGRMAILDQGGTCRVVDQQSMTPLFEYSSLVVQSCALLSSRYMVLGQSSISNSGTPLLRIDITTGETVPIFDPDLMVFKLETDRNLGRLFSLGLENRDGTTYTVLKAHRSASFDNGIPLLASRGEDMAATILYDQSDDALYTTLGADAVRKWSGSSLVSFERTNHLPRELFVQGDLLLAINSDKTLSVWNKRTGTWLLDFYLFTDGSWAMLFSDATFYSSPSGSGKLFAWNGLKSETLESRSRVMSGEPNRGKGYSVPY